MLLHGDELGRTQHGNNNVYCQDNELSWVDWDARRGRRAAARRSPAARRAAPRAPGVPPPPVLPGRGRPAAAERRRRHRLVHPGRRGDERGGLGRRLRPRRSRCSSTATRSPSRTSAASRSLDDSFLLLFNAHYEPIEFTLPPSRTYGEQLGRSARHRARRAPATASCARRPDAARSQATRERARSRRGRPACADGVLRPRPAGAGAGHPAPTAATYRLQLHGPDFGFDDAAARRRPTCADLGVSHLYLSPVLQAAPGSQHGYDVVDHTPAQRRARRRGRPSTGWSTALHERGLGSWSTWCRTTWRSRPRCGQPLLWSVLRTARRRRTPRWFDIDWTVPDRAGAHAGARRPDR